MKFDKSKYFEELKIVYNKNFKFENNIRSILKFDYSKYKMNVGTKSSHKRLPNIILFVLVIVAIIQINENTFTVLLFSF